MTCVDSQVFEVFGIQAGTVIPDNAILSWDGCNWIFIERPDVLAALDCGEVWTCVESNPTYISTINNIRAAINGKLECADLAACQEIIDIWAAINAIVPSIVWNLVTTNDAGASTVANTESVVITGVTGINVSTTAPRTVEVSLPTSGDDGDVLVWNDTAGAWVTQAPLTTSCTAVQECMAPIILSLQNQINFLLGLDPQAQAVLSCADVANCIFAGETDATVAVLTAVADFLTPGSTDLSTSLETFITNLAVWTNLVGDVAANTAGVAANLASINANILTLGDHEGRIIALEAMLPISVNADLSVITAALSNLTFNDAQFNLVETSPGVVSIDIDAAAIVGGVVDCAYIVAAVTGCGAFDTYIDGLITAHNLDPVGIAEIINASKFDVQPGLGVPGDFTPSEADVLAQEFHQVTFAGTDDIVLPELTDANAVGRQFGVVVTGVNVPTVAPAVGVTLTGSTVVVIDTAMIFLVTAVGVGATEYVRLV